jgi:hypothetical protein
MWATASDPDHDGDDDSTPQGDTDHDWWSTDGKPMRTQVEAASSLPQVQQVTDPSNQPDPGGDELPEGVAFPLGDNSPSSPFRQQWSTGPDGPQPRTGARADLEQGMAEAMAHADAANGRSARGKDDFPSNSKQHGKYLRAWNNLAGLTHGLTGRSAMSKDEYGKQTGRPDLHSHYLAAYAQGYAQGHSVPRADDGGQATASLRRQADTWTQPHATTDDLAAPYNSAATSPDPWSQQAPQSQDFAAGAKAGRDDMAAGERPLFADNSSGVSQYVKGYAEGYGGGRPPGATDTPLSMGGDSGQALNTGQAERSFQVARASRTASLRRVSAAFAPDSLMADPEFRKGYLFASKWRPGQRLVAQGSARFEAGLYAGVTDSPASQRGWAAAHGEMALHGHPELAKRLGLHASFSHRHAALHGLRCEGAYIRHAGTMTDLITDGPGTSPDPMGATPLNGPGAPPPMGGLSDPARAGGAPPYQGTAPLPGGPVVPDDVMGRPQQQPQPDGPAVQTFSGMHPENAQLAPVAPNQADQGGYTNHSAYQGDPRGNDRLAAFRRRVQAGMNQMGAR